MRIMIFNQINTITIALQWCLVLNKFTVDTKKNFFSDNTIEEKWLRTKV